MALYLYKHPKTGIWQIRGSHHGITVDESSQSRVERDAQGVLERRERAIYEEVILGKKRERNFAEAAEGYMIAGGEKKPLPRILTAKVRVDGKLRIFGELLLNEIDQTIIDALAKDLMPSVKDSTRTRHIYTPVSSVLHYAEDQRSWGFTASRIRRPKQPPGRLDWRTPQELEWWLARAGNVHAMITAYVGTGARASELVALDWPDVTPAGHRITLWEEDTKAGKARGVDLQHRVRSVLPPRPIKGDGAVWRNKRGERWTVIALQKALDRITVREARKVATEDEQSEIAEKIHAAGSAKFTVDDRNAARRRLYKLYDEVAERERIPWIHPHVFRHTWGTWAYSVTRDLPWVMAQGGWASSELAMRYIHVGTSDLAEDVMLHGWEIREDRATRRLALPRPAANTEGAESA